MTARIHKNIFYAPSLISCLCLVAVLFSIAGFTRLNKQEMVIRHFIPSDKREYAYNGWEALERIRKKKQLLFILKGDEDDSYKLALIRFSASQIKYSCDTNTVIKVHLRDETTYGLVIGLINIMLQGNHKRYILWKNDFYIFPPVQRECLEEEVEKQPVPIYL